jgi:hypothetical protein
MHGSQGGGHTNILSLGNEFAVVILCLKLWPVGSG